MEDFHTFTLLGEDILPNDSWSQIFSDLNIYLMYRCSGIEVKASDVAEFLSIRSQINKTAEKTGTRMVDLDDRLNPSALALILEFPKKRKVDINFENVYMILQVAEYLQHTQISDACLAFLMRGLNIHTVSKVHETAHEYGIKNLAYASRRYIRKRFEEYSASDDYLKLSHFCVKGIVAEDHLNVSSEDIVFQAIIRWGRNRSPEDRNILPKLLDHVRVKYVSETCLTDMVSETVMKEPDINEMIKLLMLKELDGNQFERSRREFRYDLCAVCQDTFYTYVYVWDADKRKWHILSMKTFTDSFCHAAAVDEDIYVFYQNAIEVFSSRTNMWNTINIAGYYYKGDALALYGKSICLIGVYQNAGRLRCFNTERNLKFDVDNIMTTPRFYSAAVTLGQFIYVTGGIGLNGHPLNSVEKCNLISNEWCTKVAAMLRKRAYHSCTTINGLVYVCGGITATEDCARSAEKFDPVSNHWVCISDMTIGREKPSLLSYNGRIFAFGGTNSAANDTVETYDPNTDNWECGFCVPKGFKSAVLTFSDYN